MKYLPLSGVSKRCIRCRGLSFMFFPINFAKERMGPRKQGLNRSAGKAAQGGANKNKQPKSLKNKLRDVQRLLKKASLQSAPANLDMCTHVLFAACQRTGRYGHILTRTSPFL